MKTFSPVNTNLSADPIKHTGDDTTPTTPRPSTAPTVVQEPTARDDAVTPTRANFSTLPDQRPLPSSPFRAANEMPENAEAGEQSLHRGNSQYSAKSRDSEDVNMDADDGGGEGSDNESVNADGTGSSKKKKSQKFYCTGHGPCSLSFTRSEHLARHIRKHTGERPFPCHCGRRFSRLDNLRQHAQTVHQNEDIPHDSLAATGTRFQRQVRTERVRPPGGRSRASTAGAPGLQMRGHQRGSLSLSSVGSVSSVFTQRDVGRPRPAPLVMAGEPQNRYSQEIYQADSPSGQYQYRTQSPSGFSTPTSATFSTGQNSPHWGSALQSPAMSHSRTSSTYCGHRTPGRRLSVPSVGNPFQSPHGSSFGPPILGQINSPNGGAYSPASSQISSPTSSTFWSRRESVSSLAEDPRRRTWHPDTTGFTSFTSRLQNVTSANYYSTGPPPPPSHIVPSNAPPPVQQNTMRLPGIASFDPLPRPVTPVRRQPSPMMIDTPSRAPQQQPTEQFQERPGSSHWDMGINRNLSNLNINVNPTFTDASSWATEANRAVQAQAEQSRAQPNTVRFEDSQYSSRMQPNSAYHQQTISAPPITPKSAKRQAWYHGPISPSSNAVRAPDSHIQHPSPEGSSSSEGGVPGTPRSANVAEINPSIMHSNGWVENRGGNFPVIPPQERRAPPQPPQPPQGYTAYPTTVHNYGPGPAPVQPPSFQEQMQRTTPKPRDDNMLRLEALVAVATSGENAAAY